MTNIDISKHELVPKHEIVSEKEKEELLKKYGIRLRQLPRIFLDDPAIKNLDAKVGDIIKITREMEGKKVIYYRVVVRR